MAARHFAIDSEQANDAMPSVPSAHEASATGFEFPRVGRHLKKPVVEYVPTIPVTTFAVDVPENAEADADARSHVDKIFQELEEAMRAEAQAAAQAKLPEPGQDPVPAEDEQQSAEPEPEPESTSEPEPQPVAKAAFWGTHKTADDAAARATQTLLDLDIEIDEPIFDYEPAMDQAPEAPIENDDEEGLDETLQLDRKEADGELETTAVLDHEAVKSALEGQGDIHEEHVAEPPRRERLEVSAGYVGPRSSAQRSTDLAPRKPRLGFFAAIGEFVLRLFHLDER